jgi:hypothetical protein
MTLAMKRLLLALVSPALLVVGSGTLLVHSNAFAQQNVDPAAITVDVTKTGEKYSRDGCRYLRQSRIAMSLKDPARRFGPCSVWKPAMLLRGGDVLRFTESLWAVLERSRCALLDLSGAAL